MKNKTKTGNKNNAKPATKIAPKNEADFRRTVLNMKWIIALLCVIVAVLVGYLIFNNANNHKQTKPSQNDYVSSESTDNRADSISGNNNVQDSTTTISTNKVYVNTQTVNPVQEPVVPKISTLTAGTPINKTDHTSGKSIVPGITSTYKGYTIGHCCEVSKGEWQALPDHQKDEKLKQYLK